MKKEKDIEKERDKREMEKERNEYLKKKENYRQINNRLIRVSGYLERD